MFTVHHHPQKISGHQLDQYLSQGWFRMGQSIFTCHFLLVAEQVFSTVWLRLHLPSHAMRKGQRKLLRKVESQFEVVVRKAVLDAEKQALYEQYKLRFREEQHDTLRASLLEGNMRNIYETYEVCVYDGERLIAASFFDMGADSAASIMGMFDADYERFSLGYYTMLREMNFCSELGKTYYYPGYVVPGYKRFDYKLRIGAVEYFELEIEDWMPYSAELVTSFRTERLKETMFMLSRRLTEYSVPAELMFFPTPPIVFSLVDRSFMSSPLCILCHSDMEGEDPLMVDYDIEEEVFSVYRAGMVLELLFRTEEINDLLKQIRKRYDRLVG